MFFFYGYGHWICAFMPNVTIDDSTYLRCWRKKGTCDKQTIECYGRKTAHTFTQTQRLSHFYKMCRMTEEEELECSQQNTEKKENGNGNGDEKVNLFVQVFYWVYSS